MKKIFLLLALLPLYAGGAYTKTFTWAGGTDIKTSVGGALDLQAQYFPDSLQPGDVDQTFGIMNGELAGSLKVGKKFLLKARPTGHWNPANSSTNEKAWIDLPEGYAQVKTGLGESGSLTLQLGYNIFTWGVTDGFNPLDVISARRYYDPLHSEKLGAFSFGTKIDFGFILLEGIYIPWQRESRLPGEHSRWLPREIGGDIQDSGTIFHAPNRPSYTFRPQSEYDSALRNNFAARISSHFLGMDLAGYFFDGASTVPAIAYTLNGDVVRVDANGFPLEIASGRDVALKPIYNRVLVTGASAVFPVWKLLLRVELAVTKAYRKNSAKIVEHNAEAVLEAEHTFTDEKSSLTTIGLVTWTDPQENSTATSSTPSIIRMFDRGVGMGMRWQPIELVSVEGFALFDTKHGGELLRLETGYKLDDNWKIYGAGEILEGKTSTPIGVYRKNDRIIAGLKVSL